MYDHQQNGARARAARIRLAHDNEATRLEVLRQRPRHVEAAAKHPTLSARLASAIARPRGRDDSRAHELTADCEPC
jgi:hypothetical protein